MKGRISIFFARFRRRGAWPALLLFLFLRWSGLYAQEFNFQHLNESPITVAYNVLQDKKGYIWFSTEKGLYKYDGKNYKWFNKDVYGVPFFSVFQLTENINGNVLFNTLDCKVGMVHNDSVTFLPLSNKVQEILRNGRIQILSMYVDKEDILWLSTGIGLYRTLKPNDYNDLQEVKISGRADSSGFCIKVLGNMALGYIQGIDVKTKDLGDKEMYHAMCDWGNKTAIVPFYMYKKKMMPAYFKTLFLRNGNIICTAEDRIITLFPDGTYKEQEMEGNILSLYQSKTGGVWISYWKKGLSYYPDQSMNCAPVRSLVGQDVSSVIEDNEGGIWASTLSNGVFYSKSKYSVDYSKIEGLGGNIQSAFAYNNKVLFNNGNDYLTVIHGDDIKRTNCNSGFSPFVVHDYGIRNGTIYVGGVTSVKNDTGLSRPWEPLRMKESNSRYLSYGFANSPDGKLYAINYSYLIEFDSGNDESSYLDTVAGRGKCICITAKGDIFFGTSKGLYKHANGKNIFLGGTDKLLSTTVELIREDKSGNLWIGTTREGIVIYKGGKVVITKSTENGLKSNCIKDIVFDKEGNAWVATDEGLSKVSPNQKFKAENYNTSNGLISNDINRIAISGNNIWLATRVGVNAIDMSHISKDTVPPRVYINSVFVNDTININEHKFRYNLNNFRFRVSGLTFKDNKTRFLFRLEGPDTAWHFSSSEEISFNNLGPGKYRFEAKAVNIDGVTSMQAAIFPFTIDAPVWLRWWFITFEVLFALGIIYFFIRFRLNAIQSKEAEKGRINKMIAEYQMTALSAQMNPHFVFNAINSIQDYILANDAQKAYDYLTKFAQLVRVVLNNAKEKSISLEKELESLTMYVQLEQLRFENKFDFKLSVGKEVDQYAIEVPAMIIQPYVENAIWHGLMPLAGTRKGVLNVDISQNGNELHIVVEDNGIGREKSKTIKKSAAHKSVGMEITQSRIEILNNLLGSSGSEINIYDLYKNQVEPIGTRVEIKIIVNTD
jgi:ligand-binding sensor domain-containing protein